MVLYVVVVYYRLIVCYRYSFLVQFGTQRQKMLLQEVRHLHLTVELAVYFSHLYAAGYL